jgi:hypothetical protein
LLEYARKYPGNTVRFWQISINPPGFPAPAKRFPDDEQERYAKDLLVISNEVHAVLTRTPGVAQLHWWFVGWDVNKPGVRRPVDLPWREDAGVMRKDS